MEQIYNGIINITYVLQNTDMTADFKGTLVSFDNKTFIISIHSGYPIKQIIINDETVNDFIICAWCDLVIIPYNTSSASFFKHFVKKQMEPEDKYFVNSTKIKYINNIFINLGFLPDNHVIMYNCLKSFENIKTGMPIIDDKNKLAGIVSKIDIKDKDNDIYLIYSVPIIYILKALTKKDNTKIYSINEAINNINKINNFRIICGKIYCILHKTYIPVDSYISINGDLDTYFYIRLENGREKRTQMIETENNMTNNNLIINENNIKLSYGFLSLLNLLDETELLEELIFNKTDNINTKWNGMNIIN